MSLRGRLSSAKRNDDILSCIVAAIFVLASCAPPPTKTSVPQALSTERIDPTLAPTVTATFLTATLRPTIPATDTPVPCDSRSVEYCIVDGSFIFQRPILPPGNQAIDPTYRFGSTDNGTRDPHHGVEFDNNSGTAVHAAADGLVVFAGEDKKAIYAPWPNFYGWLVVLQHDDGLFTLYAHLSKISVEAGAKVQLGDQVGAVGQSGAATGSHLHFEVRSGDVEDYFATLNPELWIIPTPISGAISFAIMDEKSKFLSAQITLQHYSAAKEILEAYYVETYNASLAKGVENAALTDLPAGQFRVTLIANGHLYERWVEVQSGKLTQIVIVVN